jgi:hypothetical protein
LLGAYGFLVRSRAPEPVVKRPMPTVYQDLKRLRDSEDATLGSYGWVDRKAGTVRIPIDRAMDLVAKRGVPKGKGPKTIVEMNGHHGTPAEAKDQETKK